MKARYDIQSDGTGWSVFDTQTGLPARVNDCPQIGMSLDDADDLADLLNHIEARRIKDTAH